MASESSESSDPRDLLERVFNSKAVMKSYHKTHGRVGANQGDNAPKREKIPKHDDITPKHGNVAPKHGNIAPKHDNITPKHGNIAPKHGNVAPKHGNISISSESNESSDSSESSCQFVVF